MTTLDIRGVQKRYGAVSALDNITLSIQEGELFFLLGPSGCGKTTLLRVIAGLCVPDSGEVRFRGTDLLQRPIEKRNIGMVFQNYSLWPHMSVFDNVAYGLRMRSMSGETLRSKVTNALALVDMSDLAERKPGELSGGQQQRVALARALVYEPEILLLDEPLSNLDARLRKDMRREIRDLHRRLGITMVYVTHDQEEAASMAQRIALLRGGALVQAGTPQQLYNEPASVYAAEFFGRANILRGTATVVEGDRVRVRCGPYNLMATRPANTAVVAGAEVALVIRPEDMRFGDADHGNQFQAVVREREFNGAVETHGMELPDGTWLTLVDIQRNAARYEPGHTATVSVDPRAVRLLPFERSGS
jgi:ABC-type Fe3+/spermidine/putrescine transport system ATPase subunit